MAVFEAAISRDGHQWTEQEGLKAGVPTIAVITPPSNIPQAQPEYDVIVVGAGYTGLTAARDLTITGHSVLLLEARDRIGGRSWSSDIGGYPFEMGGTWVHWNQPSVYREIARYNMHKELEISPVMGSGIDAFHLKTPEGSYVMNHDDELELRASGWKKFINVDGAYGKNIVPFPHDPHFNPEVSKYDQMSFADRLKQIESDLTPKEYNSLEAFLSITSGGTVEESGFFEALRWWALGNYDMQQFEDLCLKYKFRHGQSSFARKFFTEALASGRLSYAFNTPIASISDTGRSVHVADRQGRSFTAKKVVCTVPLNILHEISFSPPLRELKQEASAIGHCNKVTKVHFEAANPELRSFSGSVYSANKLTFMFGDGTTPAGNSHLVAFGSSNPGFHLDPEQDIAATIEAGKAFIDMNVKRVVFHSWHNDEFAQGAWEFLRPGMATKYLDVLRERQGNIIFASADWALGWRGFVDGAIEDGARAALEVKDELLSAVQSPLGETASSRL